jgi:hypothetical protein
VTVVDNTAAQRFEVSADGHSGRLVYELTGDRLVLTHTYVPDAVRGSGIGGRLVVAAVESAIARGLTVVPACSFARWWLLNHPEVAGRANIDWS